MKLRNLVLIIMSCFLFSCNEETSRRTPVPTGGGPGRGIEGLNGDRLELKNKLDSLVKEDRGVFDLYPPEEGESFKYFVTLSENIKQEFKLTGSNDTCHFLYSEIEIDESIRIKNDDFLLDRTYSPKNPTYAGFPDESLKTKCLGQIGQLVTTKIGTLLDLKKAAKDFRKIIQTDFLNLFTLCKFGGLIGKLGKCEGMEVFQFEVRGDGPRVADSIYYFDGVITAGGKKYPLTTVFSLRNIHWGFGGLFSWNSDSILNSKNMSLHITKFQILKRP